MLDPRLNVGRVEQHHVELSRMAVHVRRCGGQKDAERCFEAALARATRLRLRRQQLLRLRFAVLRRG
jgi:hypothetical protein